MYWIFYIFERQRDLLSDDSFVTIKTADGRYLKTGLSDYVTEFGSADGVIAFVNNRNMLVVEELREPEEGEVWEEKFKTHKGYYN